MRIHFSSECIDFLPENPDKIKNWLLQAAEKEGFNVIFIEYIFTSDENIIEINKKYLNHNYFTDIITFDRCVKNRIEGDIFISIPTIIENAKVHSGGNFTRELYRVMIHGLLHLCGYKDASSNEKELMRDKENFYLKALTL